MNLTYTRESSYFLFYFWNQIHSSCYVIYLLTNYIATYFFFIFIQFATTIKDVNNTWYSGFSTLWLAIFYREVDFYIWICNFEMNGYIWGTVESITLTIIALRPWSLLLITLLFLDDIVTICSDIDPYINYVKVPGWNSSKNEEIVFQERPAWTPKWMEW